MIISITFRDFSRSFDICAPDISFASGDNCSPIFWTTCLYSSNDKSVPPITLTNAPCAFLMSTSSSGLFNALSTASIARSFESDSPIPISDTPPFAIIALMSAKSRFTSPDDVTNSVIPFTAFVRISSATLKAVGSGKSGARSKSLSLGITINVSTIPSILSNPSIAFSIRFAPSTVNGNVTTPITKAPCFFAISATTGAAPVPVPPPSPHVTKTRSEPWSFFLISCCCSFAASAPILGFDPAPKPFDISRPIRIFWSAFAYNKSCASVLIAMISPPLIPISRILEVVFPPPPPTPITFIRAVCFFKISSNSRSISEFALCCEIDCECISGMSSFNISSIENLGQTSF